MRLGKDLRWPGFQSPSRGSLATFGQPVSILEHFRGLFRGALLGDSIRRPGAADQRHHHQQNHAPAADLPQAMNDDSTELSGHLCCSSGKRGAGRFFMRLIAYTSAAFRWQSKISPEAAVTEEFARDSQHPCQAPRRRLSGPTGDRRWDRSDGNCRTRDRSRNTGRDAAATSMRVRARIRTRSRAPDTGHSPCDSAPASWGSHIRAARTESARSVRRGRRSRSAPTVRNTCWAARRWQARRRSSPGKRRTHTRSAAVRTRGRRQSPWRPGIRRGPRLRRTGRSLPRTLCDRSACCVDASVTFRPEPGRLGQVSALAPSWSRSSRYGRKIQQSPNPRQNRHNRQSHLPRSAPVRPTVESHGQLLPGPAELPDVLPAGLLVGILDPAAAADGAADADQLGMSSDLVAEDADVSQNRFQ